MAGNSISSLAGNAGSGTDFEDSRGESDFTYQSEPFSISSGTEAPMEDFTRQQDSNGNKPDRGRRLYVERIIPVDFTAGPVSPLHAIRKEEIYEYPPPLFQCAICHESLSVGTTKPTTAYSRLQILNPRGRRWPRADMQFSSAEEYHRAIARKTAQDNKRLAKRLDGIHPVELATTPCGHMFHRYCIERWFMQLPGPKSCPNCRKSYGQVKLIQIFPTRIYDDEEGEDNRLIADDDEPIITRTNNFPSTSTGASNASPTGSNFIRNNCESPPCVGLRAVHETLMKEFSGLQDRYFTVRDDLTMRTGELTSLQKLYDGLKQEIAERNANDAARKRPRN